MLTLVLWVSLVWALIVTLVSVGGKNPTFIDALIIYVASFIGAFLSCLAIVGIWLALAWLATL